MQMHHTTNELGHATAIAKYPAVDAGSEIYISAAMIKVAALAIPAASADSEYTKAVQVVALEAAARIDSVLEAKEADRVADLGFVDVFNEYVDARRAHRQADAQGLDNTSINERFWSAEREMISYPCRSSQRKAYKIREILRDKDLFEAVCDGRDGHLVRALLQSLIAEA